MLLNDKWEHIDNLLQSKVKDPGRTAKDDRPFVEALFGIIHTGNHWRDLPAEYGHWHRINVRVARCHENGASKRVADALCGDADREYLFIDFTIVSARQHSVGALIKWRARKSADRAAV